jgi:hypothetical protein
MVGVKGFEPPAPSSRTLRLIVRPLKNQRFSSRPTALARRAVGLAALAAKPNFPPDSTMVKSASPAFFAARVAFEREEYVVV